MTLLSVEQVAAMRHVLPDVVQPSWKPSFAASSLAWMAKLRELLQASGNMDASGLAHNERLLRGEMLELLPSGITLNQKLHTLRSLSGGSSQGLVQQLADAISNAADVAFPKQVEKSTPGQKLIHLVGAQHGERAFNSQDLEVGMYVVYSNEYATDGISIAVCPIRL